jgi:hypothetical protein
MGDISAGRLLHDGRFVTFARVGWLLLSCTTPGGGECRFQVESTESPCSVRIFTGSVDRKVGKVIVDPIAGHFDDSPFWQIAGDAGWHLQYRPKWNMAVFTPEEDTFNQDLLANVRQTLSEAQACDVAPPVLPPRQTMKVTFVMDGTQTPITR